MNRRASGLGRVLPGGLVLLFVAFAIARLVIGFGGGHSHRSGTSAGPSHARPHRGGSGPQPLGIPGDWRLVLNSRFTGSRLDTKLWRPEWFGSGVTGPINRHESACYSPGNVSLSAGTLHMTVSRNTAKCGAGRRPFTGAVLSTNPDDGRGSGGFTYRYGVLEARIYFPGTGARVADWPAVVTLGRVWPRDGEDDVVENLSGLMCSHFHSPGYAPGGGLGGCDPGFVPGWHVVSSDWEPGSVTWYYDGIEVARASRGVTSAPMYIVLVNSTSSKSPRLARPDVLRVAYVRVWRRLRRGS